MSIPERISTYVNMDNEDHFDFVFVRLVFEALLKVFSLVTTG